MNANLVRIDPIEKTFSITWSMHTRCNNDCMYCGELHDDHSDLPSLELLQRRWLEIFKKTKHKNLKYKISLSGGELMINRDFLPFINWLTENYEHLIHNIGITTNGTASKQHYLKVFEHLKYITFSTHTESMDIDKFFDKARALNEFAAERGKFFMLNIMQEFWAVDKIKHMIDLCHHDNIYYSIGTINHNLKRSRKYPIFRIARATEERQDLMVTPERVEAARQAIQDHIKLYDIPEETYHNLVAYYDDGRQVKTYASRIKWLNLANFRDWYCDSGVTRIVIRADSSVYNGECQNRFLGNLDDHSFELISQAHQCTSNSCTNNPDDIMIHKQKSQPAEHLNN